MDKLDARVTRHRIGRAVKGVLLTCALCVTAFVLFFAVSVFKLDAWHDFEPSLILDTEETLIIYETSGAEYTRLHSSQDRIPIGLSDVPDIVKKAFISAEDARFYDHIGIDFIRIGGAVIEDIRAGGYVQGASTISQQLIKLSHLTADKTISRKIEEAVLACQMEKQFSKDEILEMYLNYVYFGGGYYGIEAASLGYFGVPAEKLTAAKGAMLAGILKSPSRYAPHIDLDASLSRRNHILELMHEYGYLSERERDEAKSESAVIIHDGRSDEKRGSYMDAAMRRAMDILQTDMEGLLTGGYRIYTAMDVELQAKCEELFKNRELFPVDDCEAALVIQQAQSGLITAMVGGRGESVAMGFNRATDIRRQPGSVIKPLIAYAPALESTGYTAATMLLDEPTSFGDYSPNNYGDKYYGWVTMREAVTRSLNIPAVKVLSDIGVGSGKQFASECGIAFDESDTSLTLALGGFAYGVSPVQIAGAYGMFASGGEYSTPSLITKITDSSGKNLYEYIPERKRVMSEASAYVLTSMLSSAISEGTGRRLGELGIPLAGKTGTVGESEGNRDAWMAAYNPQYSAAVWMGYDSSADGKSLPDGATGGKYPALVLYEVFSYLYPDGEAPGFVMPEGVTEVRIDARTLKSRHTVVLANGLTPKKSVMTEVFTEGTEPDDESDYWVVPSTPRDFTAILDEDGRPSISFTAVQDFVLYRLIRTDASGASTVLNEWRGMTGRHSFVDETAQYGETYAYHVLPVHPELQVGSRQVTGPETKTTTLTLPRVQFYPGGKPPNGSEGADDDPIDIVVVG